MFYNNIESTFEPRRTDAQSQPETPSAPKTQTVQTHTNPKKIFYTSDKQAQSQTHKAYISQSHPFSNSLVKRNQAPNAGFSPTKLENTKFRKRQAHTHSETRTKNNKKPNRHTRTRQERRKTNILNKIKELKDGMKRVEVEAKVVEIEPAREVMARYKDMVHRVANAKISDDTGTIKLTLWNNQIEQVKQNDTIKVTNGYITSFRGEIQLNVGRYGTLTVLT